jgi:hypothetical protein
MKYFIIMIAAFFIIGHSSATELQMEKSAFPPALFEMMKILSDKTDVVNYDKKFISIKTNRFEISNLYVIPFIYSKINSGVKKTGDYTADEINGMFAYFVYDLAKKYIFFYEAFDNGVIAESIDMDKYIKENNIDFQSRVFSREFMYNDVIKAVIVQKYIDRLFANAQVTVKDIEEYYITNPSTGMMKKRAVVRLIRMSYKGLNETQKAAKRLAMEEVLIQLGKDGIFSGLSKKYSDDPGTANSGGLVGDYVEEGEAGCVLERIIFSMKPGDISGVTEYQEAFYIFKVEKIVDEQRKSLSEMKDEIAKIILQKKKQQLLVAETKRLEKKFGLEIKPVFSQTRQ